MSECSITLHVDEPQPITLDYIEAKIKPETVGHATPTEQAQTVTPAPGTTFSAVEVDAISPEYVVPSGTLDITENASGIDIRDKAVLNVNVPQGVFPEGTLPVIENGVYDVTNFIGVNVNVPVVFDMGRLTLEMLTITIPDDFVGTLNAALSTLFNIVPDEKKIGGVSNCGIVYASLLDTPTDDNQFISYGMNYNNGSRITGRRWNNNRIVIQNDPAINSWQANLKAGTSYKIAWMTFE